LRYVATPPEKNKVNHFANQVQLENYHGQMDEFEEWCTQYCSFSRKKPHGQGDYSHWMASHPDDLHETFKKLLFFSDLKRDAQEESLSERGDDLRRLLIYQPVLVLQGGLFKGRTTRNSVQLSKAKHVLFDFHFQYKPEPSYLLIDVITETHLPQYLTRLSKEAMELGQICESYLSEH
jgi:hypothetical protein